jgi:kinetochore protein NDC80
MTLSTLPPNSAPRNADNPQKPKADKNASAAKNSRLPPKGRQSMIPRVGRENNPPPVTPNSISGNAVPIAAGSTATGTNHRRDSLSSMRRQSMLPSSSGSVNSSVGQRADPRPINDKAFQLQCIKELFSFLQELGYEYPVSTKSLSRPSAKDFTNMTTFLLRQVDKDFQRGGMKFEDEVALNFKCMGYPYPISKTALVAAGTPHTWPALLAALTWLMHQLQCKNADIQRIEVENETTKDFSSIADLETQTDNAFFQYMGQAYSAFMKGDAEALEKLETAFMQRFERDDAFLAQAVERVTDLNASIVERINEIAQQSEEYVAFLRRINYSLESFSR